MSAAAFKALLNGNNGANFKQWLTDLKSIIEIKGGSAILRPGEQVKDKTDFLITPSDVVSMYRNMTGSYDTNTGQWIASTAEGITLTEAKDMLDSGAGSGKTGTVSVNGKDTTFTVSVNGKDITFTAGSRFFPSKNFNEISNVVRNVFNSGAFSPSSTNKTRLEALTKALKDGRDRAKAVWVTKKCAEIDAAKTLEEIAAILDAGEDTHISIPWFKKITALKDETAKQEAKNLIISKAEKDTESKKFGIGYFYHKSHLVGVATNLSRVFQDALSEKLGQFEASEDEQRKMLEGVDFYIKHLLAEDAKRFPKVVTDIELDAAYTVKTGNTYRYLVTMELAVTNTAGGTQAQKYLNNLRDLVKNPDTLLKSLNLTGDELALVEGSTPYLDLIGQDIAKIIGNKTIANKTKTIPKTLINKGQIKALPTESLKPKIAQYKNIERKVKASLAKTKSRKQELISSFPYKTSTKSSSIIRAVPINLSALQGLINQHLQNVISANMGDGSQRNILNYRTGRFAGSTKVESMSQSRAGMITAFYSYMKNPYATFAEGGNQENPRTRNPKLLISKSIREIAMGKVGNRLRAVAL